MQIQPIRIHLFDDSDLPIALPFLELLLAADGIFHRVVMFIPNQQLDIMVSSEAFEELIFMVADAVPECAGYAHVDCATVTVGGDVNGGEFFFAHKRRLFHAENLSRSWAPAFAGVTEEGQCDGEDRSDRETGTAEIMS